MRTRTLALILTCTALWAGTADRRVAEWTLTMGGRVVLQGQSVRLHDISQLPAGDFDVVVLDWVGVNADPPDLERLTGLRALRELHLGGPFWNRNADSGRDGSKDLKYLAPIATLEAITFGYHFLDNIRFRDAGLTEIKGLTGMRELVLRQSGVQGHTLEPFRQLQAFDCTLCPFDDAGLKNLAGMADMRRLWIGDTAVTDAGMQVLAGMAKLEDLDIHGTVVTGAGLAHLQSLTGLRKLNLMGLPIGDADIAFLSGMKHLEELNLYRTRVTNAGLAPLHQLRKLAAVDLRYSRVTRGGVESLTAALPSVRVQHLELASRPKAARDAAALRGDAWLAALGGRRAGNAVFLAGSAVTDAQLVKLADLGAIRRLDLPGTEIGDAGVAHIARLASIEELNLSSTSVSDAGIAALKALPKLRKLTVRNTYVEGTGIESLQALEELDFHGSPVSSSAVERLGTLPKLRKLSPSRHRYRRWGPDRGAATGARA